ncbi:hypothetical protein SHKM778_94910 (plasmid) [Streptomyces sp. KM77-8]|uniref:Uncharacterized protein n=1 Tax=Streptomyces haneummycinicus TaxID=3074435 RepID=A0AAT9HZH5_9ACTN
MWQLRESAHPVLTDEGGAILDERTGRWTHLTPTASAAVMLLLAGTPRRRPPGSTRSATASPPGRPVRTSVRSPTR